ncbi:MAG: helix-turn-helix transcriptional regulator [Deltaproteobacteria bacterium]|nr:helix-turn-helix transcriptional regulator [Deltaproteobacteria bacterium]
MEELTDLNTKEMKGLLDLSYSISSGCSLDDFRTNALQFLMDSLASPAGNFFIAENDAKTLSIANVLTHNVDMAAFVPYAEYYQYLDPFLQRPLNSMGASVVDDFVDFDRFLRGEYYNDFIKPQGIFHQMGMSLTAHGRCVGVVALFRPESDAKFTAAEKAKASLMLPYLASGLERVLLAEYGRQKKWILESSLQGLGGHGIVVLGADLNVVFANEEAQLQLAGGKTGGGSQGHSMGGGNLSFPEELSALCTRTARQLPLTAAVPEGLLETTWTDAEGHRRHARVQVISGYFFGEKAHFLVVHLGTNPAIRALGLGLPESVQLTARENEIAEEVIKGASNAQVAEALFISVYTVENHLKKIFRKTGVRSRAELCSRFLAAAQGSSPRQPSHAALSPGSSPNIAERATAPQGAVNRGGAVSR